MGATGAKNLITKVLGAGDKLCCLPITTVEAQQNRDSIDL